MNLIGENKYIMLPAQAADPGKVFPAPDFSDRVLRVAEEQHGDLRIGKLLLQVTEIHFILPVPVDERILQYLPAVAVDAADKMVIYRRLDDDLLTGDGEFPDCCGQGGDYPGGKGQLFIADFQAVVLSPPVPVSVVQLIRNDAVAKNTVGGTLLNGPADAGRGREVHIRHPHGQLIFRQVPFQRTGSGPVGDLIKTVIHFCYLFHKLPGRQASRRCDCAYSCPR